VQAAGWGWTMCLRRIPQIQVRSIQAAKPRWPSVSVSSYILLYVSMGLKNRLPAKAAILHQFIGNAGIIITKYARAV